jgi:carbonic anhydrase
MKSFKTLAVSLLLSAVTTVQAAGDGKWSYLQNGHDWKYDETSECHLPMQSPIDLKTSGIKKVSARKRYALSDGNIELNTKYENLNAKEVKVNGFTVQVDFKEQMDTNYF